MDAVAGQENRLPRAHAGHEESPETVAEREAIAESAWRKFLSFYDSLQWHMYL